jgi:hypothetical protein
MKLKVKFVDFWPGYNPENHFILKLLRSRYEVELCESPDYLFFSTFGDSHYNYNCVKILYIGENLAPDFNVCDYAIGFDHLEFGDRYLRLPLYLVRKEFELFPREKNVLPETVLNRGFCSIVVSNARYADPLRERFFRLLSEYKKVDSGGMLWNNVGGSVPNKLDFVAKYKFNIAFENSSVYGYTTEKIMDAMVANSLPIYWGNKAVGKDFNKKSFLDANDFPSLEALVERVVELDSNDEMYLQMLQEPWILDEHIFDWKESLFSFFTNIFLKPLSDARYLSDYGMQYIYRKKMRCATSIYSHLRIARFSSLWAKIKTKL